MSWPPVAHRPYPPPDRPWAGHMVWSDLLFLHWPVEPAALRRAMPPGLRLELRDGVAWLTVAAFRMSEVHPRALPPLPGHARFPEINVRTYVTMDGRPGVYFFSLDVPRVLAVAGARAVFALRYFVARMSVRASDGWVDYESRRLASGPAGFHARYRAAGSLGSPAPGTLEHWLTARYCLYAVRRRGAILRAEIHHADWVLREADVDLVDNSMAAPLGLALDTPELVQYADPLEVFAWWPDRVERPERPD
jgi:uncharacterized protein